jgi:hypothetical protein
VSTGTNNVFPGFVDGSSAGTAAGLLSRGALDLDAVGRPAKVLHVEIRHADGTADHDIALVDVALIDDVRTGSRAILRSGSIRAVIAAIATPTSTGLSAIAGRVRPIGRHTPGAVAVRLGGDRIVRVPIGPGSFDELRLDRVEVLGEGESIEIGGAGVLAYDGERDRILAAGDTATITIRTDGPILIDVDRALHCAVSRRLFDVQGSGDIAATANPDGWRDVSSTPEAPHGD